jgi:hypothetical protein
LEQTLLDGIFTLEGRYVGGSEGGLTLFFTVQELLLHFKAFYDMGGSVGIHSGAGIDVIDNMVA